MQTVLITGGSGLIGGTLSQMLINKGFEVRHLSRTLKPKPGIEVYKWDIAKNEIDDNAIIGADYIIHLAGAGIADKRWTPKRKKEIIDSRVKSLALLTASLTRTNTKPKAFVSTSAVGYYGDRKDDLLKEDDEPGQGFLSEVCEKWEKATKPIEALGIPLKIVRVGIVLSTKGGALVEMDKSIPFHIAGYLGDGKQYYPWIHIDDITNIFYHVMSNENTIGVYNGVAPNPKRNKDLVDTIAKAKGVAAISIPAPAFALKLAMGEMSTMLLNSNNASSNKIEQTGFEFAFPNLMDALADVYKRKV